MNQVKLIGNVTASTIDLSYFSSLEGDNFVTADFSIVPYHLGKPIEIDGLMLGYEYRLPDGRIVYSYDHHGPDERMEKIDITSTSLAMEVMRRKKTPFERVYVTHTDTDSVLSAFILLTGILDDRLSEAAVAADHTGAENYIADVLQSLTELRDIEFSFLCLHSILHDRPLPEEAQKHLKMRLNDRKRAAQYIQEGVIAHVGNGVYAGRFEEMLPGELLPALIPEAKIIVLVSQLKSGLKEIKVRAGLKFPSGMSLNRLGIQGYGGRWNAGSTKRYGGTPEGDVDAFIDQLIKSLKPCANILSRKRCP